MDYLFLAISALVIATSLYFVISPFFGGTAQEHKSADTENQVSLELVYSSINELEMDYLMKKISEDDYLQLKQSYQQLAAEQLKKSSETPVETKKAAKELAKLDQEILNELKALRGETGSGAR